MIKCPKCQREGLISTVWCKEHTKTLMGYGTYHDKEGKLHNHDGNANIFNYQCSKDHKFCEKVVFASTCCDELKGKKEVIESW